MDARNELEAARATAALWAHLRIHLAKEEAHLYPVLAERLSPAEQAHIVEQLAGTCSPMEAQWAVRRVGNDDREALINAWMNINPRNISPA